MGIKIGYLGLLNGIVKGWQAEYKFHRRKLWQFDFNLKKCYNKILLWLKLENIKKLFVSFVKIITYNIDQIRSIVQRNVLIDHGLLKTIHIPNFFVKVVERNLSDYKANKNTAQKNVVLKQNVNVEKLLMGQLKDGVRVSNLFQEEHANVAGYFFMLILLM